MHLKNYKINEWYIDILRQFLYEFEDVRLSACIFDLFLGDLFLRFYGTKQDVEPNSTSVKGRLLRHQCQLFTVLLDIELADTLAIELEEKNLLNG